MAPPSSPSDDAVVVGHGNHIPPARGSLAKKRHLTKRERKALKQKRKPQKPSVKEMTTTTTTTLPGYPSSSASSLSSQSQQQKKKKNKKRKRQQQKPKPQQDDDDDGIKLSMPQQRLSSPPADEATIWAECLKTYRPIAVPQNPSADLLLMMKRDGRDGDGTKKKLTTMTTDALVGGDEEGGASRSLGKWFPTALLVKCKAHYTNTGQLLVGDGGLQDDYKIVAKPIRASLVLFYHYNDASKHWDQRQLQLLMTYLQDIARQRNIGGRIRVAPEGVNATLSAVDVPVCTAQAALRHLAEDLKRFDSMFQKADFKYIDDLPSDRHFKELKILPVQELVFYDIGADEAPLHAKGDEEKEAKIAGSGDGVHHLEAKAYHEMLQKDNTVVIDVRNHYETILGRFDGQTRPSKGNDETNISSSTSKTLSASGAEYIDPKMRKSTDFKQWLQKEETQERLKDKTVLMFCTGGIRCERASVYLKGQMGDQVKNVYQLQGGIERYLQAFPEGGMWRGKNFVFDKREAVGVDCREGDGGVVRKQKKAKGNTHDNDSSSGSAAKCCVCDKPWDRYIGKKKCLTCGVPVLMCDGCMSQKPDKTLGMELKVRCPLCVEEGITVLASQVELTHNGIKGKRCDDTFVTESAPSRPDDDNGDKDDVRTKAAVSVLKWGGGHANQKKQRKKMKRVLCQFGADCVRKDCFFSHPELEAIDRGKFRRK